MTDDAEAFGRSVRRARRTKLAFLVLLGLTPFGVVGWIYLKRRRDVDRERVTQMLPDAEAGELRSSLARAKASLESTRTAFANAMTADALAKLAPTGEKCPHQLPVPTGDHANEYYAMYGRIDPNYFGELRFALVDDPAHATPAALDGVRGILDVVETALAKQTATKADAIRLGAISGLQQMDVVTVGKRTEAVVGVTEFQSGTIKGSSYLYDHRVGRVVCTAAIDIKNSSVVTARVDKAQEALARDLSTQLRYAVAAGLRKVQ